MKVLLVEDSLRLRKYLREALESAGYAVDVASDGEDGLWLAQGDNYDVVVLDLMLPKLDGLSVLGALRRHENKTHVLILTAKDTVEDRVRGLEQGADDYLIKPFAMSELLARVQALVRRRYRIKSPSICVEHLVIDTVRRRVVSRGEFVALTPREYALLEYLVYRRGEVVSRSDIEEHIYDDAASPMSNVVDAAVYALRKKIDAPGAESLIETCRGLGYRFRFSES